MSTTPLLPPNPSSTPPTPARDDFGTSALDRIPAATPTKVTPEKSRERFPENLPSELNLILGTNGNAYAVMKDAGNPFVLQIGSRVLNNIIREIGRQEGHTLRRADIGDINHFLQAHAEMKGLTLPVWYRVAPVEGGIEIDLGDDSHSRVRITPSKVEILAKGSSTLFYRTSSSLPMTQPAETGDLKRLRKYLNVHPTTEMLLIGWLSFTLAHPKQSTTKYPIMVLAGGQGSGKTFLCQQVILRLLDPNRVGVQILPSNGKDLAIAATNAHVLCYDNIRNLTQDMADNLCIASTGGAITGRQLYTDADQHVLPLHAAIVLNGIHSFIDQPDLAQRCLPIQLLPIKETSRKSEAEFVAEMEQDLPAIQRGMFDFIAEISRHLPDAEVTNPERMIDFSKWLAAMEKVYGAPSGAFQELYSEAINDGQLDSLLDSPLAAAVFEFVVSMPEDEWSDTPAELLKKLNANATHGTQRSRDWPQNPIALSKRLAPLQAGFQTQGIELVFTRGKHRTITIRRKS